MAGEIAPRNNAGLGDIAQLFLGKSSSGSSNTAGAISGSRTTQESVAPGAVDAVVKAILEGSQGLAAVANGQRRAGLYNSSTNNLMVNDLVARAAAEGAKLNKSTTVTDTQSTVQNQGTAQRTNPQIKPGTAIGASIVSSLIPKDVKTGIKNRIMGTDDGAPVRTAGAAKQNLDDPTETDVSDYISRNDGATASGLDSQNIGGLTIDNTGEATAGAFGTNFTDGFTDSGSVDAAATAIIDGFTEIDYSGAVDAGADIAAEFDYSNFDLGFADGGMVRKRDSENLFQRRKAALDAGMDAADSGNDNQEAFKRRMDQQTREEDAKGKPKTFMQRLIPTFADGGMVRLKGYADGGLVDLANTGLRKKGATGAAVLGTADGDQSVSDVVARSLTEGTSATNTASRKDTTGRGRLVANTGDLSASGTDSGEASTATPGATGSGIGTTAAGVVGLTNAALGISAPGAIGLASATNNAAAVNAAISGMIGVISPMLGVVTQLALSQVNNPDSLENAAATASAANTSPNATEGLAAIGNVSDADPLDAVVDAITQETLVATPDINASLDAPVNTPTPGVGSGSNPGPAGVGTEGGGTATSSDGSGVGTGDGTGTAFKQGGKVNGPGTTTSDSILARLSDGEHVTKAKSVQLFGEDFMDAVNQGDPQRAIVEMFKKGLV